MDGFILCGSWARVFSWSEAVEFPVIQVRFARKSIIVQLGRHLANINVSEVLKRSWVLVTCSVAESNNCMLPFGLMTYEQI
jgi:hypothetical protein